MSQSGDVSDPDPYATEECRWWHLSEPSPELLDALEDGWLRPGRTLDVGCGLASELAFLRTRGFGVVGLDLSALALVRAARIHPNLPLVRCDALALTFPAGAFDVLLDRGAF